MANLSFRAASDATDQSATANTLAVTKPTGTVENDLLDGTFVTFIAAPDAAPTHTLPSGWSVAASGTFTIFGGGIQADTEDLQVQIGTAGAGLTAIPWNAAWDAEVQSEVADALDADIPAVPTAGSINDVLNDLDGRLPASGTLATAANVSAVETDTQDIQSRLPAALNNGVMQSDVQRINDVAIVGDGSVTPFNV